ncbi:MAG: RNase adapter RapZ, partial [Gammaproteobacteria bacterium]
MSKKLVILSGRSGSGKTIALHALEDQEFYCIDNLPLSMMVDLVDKLSQHHDQLAVSIDARAVPDDLADFDSVYQQLKQSSYDTEVIFLDADDATLLKRFSETRRRHPLTQSGLSLREAISKETALLESIRLAADLNIDSSILNVHQLRDMISSRVN